MWIGLKEIRKLRCNFNEITTISQASFGPDLDITCELFLNENNIVHIDPDTFKSMLNGPVFLALVRNKLEWVPCFQNKHSLLSRHNQTKALRVRAKENPLRCQPCSCWIRVLRKSYDDECQKPRQPRIQPRPRQLKQPHAKPVCEQLGRLANNFLDNRCCKAIETEPNTTCLANPKAFGFGWNELNLKTTKSIRKQELEKKKACTLLEMENMRYSKKDNLSVPYDKELHNVIINTITSYNTTNAYLSKTFATLKSSMNTAKEESTALIIMIVQIRLILAL